MNVQPKKIRLPSKNTINLAAVSNLKTNWKIMGPMIAVVAIAIIAFAKFGVIDLYVEQSKAEKEVSDLQAKVDSYYDKIEDYGDIVDLYAHYTFSDMEPEELGRVDRSQMIGVMERVLAPKLKIKEWSVVGNVLMVTVSGQEFGEVNEIAQALNDEEIVDVFDVKKVQNKDEYTDKASTVQSDNTDPEKITTVQIMISFVSANDVRSKEVTAG